MTENRYRFHSPRVCADALLSFERRILALLVALLPSAAFATDVSVIGLFPGKAVVVIDGGALRTLAVGRKPVEGVSLISTDSDSATLEIDGHTRTLKIGQHHAGRVAVSSSQSATLSADPRGHFVVEGLVNGGSVRFLVDTGATSVALSSADAVRLGIDYRKGQPAIMNTANGTATAYQVKLDTVRVGDIVLNNVDAAVLEGGPMPFALLGMSFLNRTEMKRDGQTMVLTRRF
jgi:aspartyl protease family protein